MPAIVRRLFEMAMGQADANRNGIPDVFESALGVATPPPSGGTDQAESATTANVSIAYPPPEDKPIMTAIDKAANSLDTFLRILLGIVSLAILAGAIFLMVKLDSGSRSQGGRFYIAIAALVILGAVDSQFRQLIERRAPFSIATTETEKPLRHGQSSSNADLDRGPVRRSVVFALTLVGTRRPFDCTISCDVSRSE